MITRFAGLILLLCLPILSRAQDNTILRSADSLYNAGDYTGCLRLEGALQPLIAQQIDTTAANTLFYLGDSYRQLGNTGKALSYLEQEVVLREKLVSIDPEGYSSALYTLAQLHSEVGQIEEARSAGEMLVTFDRKTFGKASETAIYSTLLLVDILVSADQFRRADDELQIALKSAPLSLRGQVRGKLAFLLGYQGLYSQSSRQFVQALKEIQSQVGDTAQDYQLTLANFGYLHVLQGKYDYAEEELSLAMKSIQEHGWPGLESSEYATLNNLALAHQALGQLGAAEKEYLEILKRDSASIGTDHPDYGITLSNLGLVYIDAKKFTSAESVLKRAIDIQRKSGGATLSYAIALNNLAKVFTRSKAPQKSVPLLTESLHVIEKQLGKRSPEYATALFNLGVAYLETGSSKSLEYIKKATALRKELLGTHHPRYAECLEKLAIYQWQKKNSKATGALFRELFLNYYTQIDNYFPVLTEEEKSEFFYNRIRPSNETFTTWAIENKELGELYDIQLNTKGIVLFATDKLRRKIVESKDSSLIRMFDRWEAQKELLAFHYGQNHSGRVVDSLIKSSAILEKELSRKSAAFTKEILRPKVSWRDVQKTLKPGVAAMEMVRYQVFEKDSARLGSKVQYAALILTSASTNGPELVMIPNGDQLETRYLRYYRNGIRFQVDDTYSYPALWQPVHEKLMSLGITTLHVSADGVYHQIALNTLFNTSTQKYLIEELIIHNVNSTRDLVTGGSRKLSDQGFHLFGFPAFSVNHDSVALQKSNQVSVSRSIRGSLNRFMNGGTITALPGTQSEIKEINSLLASHQTRVYTGREANEFNIKQTKSPRVLHIATHGFFFDDYLQHGLRPPNPLLNSGLILAGASNFIVTGYNPVHFDEDGILTAYEALNLELDNTEIVILSACETGLGEQRNGEGVYGLQRAFKLAGADGVVMSLWAVDDQATRDLMTLFYQKWISTSDLKASFRQAQLEILKKYKAPYYWGAFVVVN